MHKLLLRYTLALMNMMAQTAACNRTHEVEQRCARWLLMTHDRVHKPVFELTQEFLAQMLGVRRPTVSIAASILSKARLINYDRGRVRIVDREAGGSLMRMLPCDWNFFSTDRLIANFLLPRSSPNVLHDRFARSGRRLRAHPQGAA